MSYSVDHFDKDFFTGKSGEKGGDRIKGGDGKSLGILYGVALALHKTFGSSNHSFLEVGAGVGWISRHLQNLGEKVEATELSEYAVEHAVAKNVRQGDVRDLFGEAPSSFDIVVCWNVLAYLESEDIQIALKSLSYVAKKYIVLSISSTEALKVRPHGILGRKTFQSYSWWRDRMNLADLTSDTILETNFNNLFKGGGHAFVLKVPSES